MMSARELVLLLLPLVACVATADRLEKVVNLTCVAVQEASYISSTISCAWDTVPQSTHLAVTYSLIVQVISVQTFNVSTSKTSAKVNLDVFPNHMMMEIWVEAWSRLGSVESKHLKEDACWFVKTNPPGNVTFISEETFPSSLLINWTPPIAKEYLKLMYEIRFCSSGSQTWTYVPLVDTAKDIQSFRLQSLRPDTVYITQVRCKNTREGHGYWSEWSANITQRTPEAEPAGKPDLWRIIAEGDNENERQVLFISKDPPFPNGKITSFNIKFQTQMDKWKNGSLEWEKIPVITSEAESLRSQRTITSLKQIHLADKQTVRFHVIAFNSVGGSAEASLSISEKAHKLAPVEALKVWPKEGQLWLSWKPPINPAVSEYVVQWVSSEGIDWQREKKNTTHTSIKGSIQKFLCYNVSVYPIYSGWIGRSASVEAFLEQAAPLEGPSIEMNDKPGPSEAVLAWKEVPKHKRRGFITSYTIFYTSGEALNSITVSGNTTSYKLKSLLRNTKYDAWVRAWTSRGYADGFNHTFTTLKYAPGEIEVIVVGVSLGFLFVVILTMLLCIYKRDVIKQNFWPQIPDPGESTIGNWSPDYPLKAETPKDNCPSGISILDVDPCDGKSVFEEDKASLPLKKDKYLSEEHSSGIGGSSCMSSPRQSVSDSDEGGDMADTTASTVQYSSVVAASGYKGQTPSSQPQQAIFSRSESTQPLLDCEDHPDMLVQEGSRQFQHFLHQPCFSLSAGNQDCSDTAGLSQLELLEPLDFCPLEEDSETPTDSQAAAGSSYMPQLGGYRPQ
ncbi:interleukin-6 receptor subunit beta isoform 2-T2 [Aulostomus maculatus]